MEVSMLRLTWLTVAQHVFQPALTGRLELISRKIVSCEPGTKAIAVSRFREKLSPANWVQGVTAISRKISRSWAPKNGVQHATAIYPIPRYTRPRYIGLTLYRVSHKDEIFISGIPILVRQHLYFDLFCVPILNSVTWACIHQKFQSMETSPHVNGLYQDIFEINGLICTASLPLPGMHM